MKTQTKEELHKRMRKIEEERDDLRRRSDRLRDRREDEEWLLRKQYKALDDMRMQTTAGDQRMLALLEDIQNQINCLGRVKEETSDSFKEDVRKKNLEWDRQEEDISEQIYTLEQEEDERNGM